MTTTQHPPDILSAEFAADPYTAYRIMREDTPLIRHAPMPSCIVSRYEDVLTRGPEAVPVRSTPTPAWRTRTPVSVIKLFLDV